MDVLSDILQVLKLKSSVYFHTRLRAPWGVGIPEHPKVVRFHIVVHGECWASVPDGQEPTELHPGDVFIIPHGRQHDLYSDPEVTRYPMDVVLEEGDFDGETLAFGEGDGPETNMVCGHFEFDDDVVHPLLETLPNRINVAASSSADFTWLDSLMRGIGRESRLARPGSGAVLNRLTEILFIQVLRAFIDEASEDASCMAGLSDRYVGDALRRIHCSPGHPWTVDELSRQVGLSRTALSLRFGRMMGISPGQYLTRWRMQLARKELLESRKSLALIGEEVGYQSEASFNKVFKRHFGIGPGTYRRKKLAA